MTKLEPDPVELALPDAAALAVAVADYDDAAVAAILIPLNESELHALAIALAANVNLDAPLTMDPKPVSIESTAERAMVIAGQMFGVSLAHIKSPSRKREVIDARSVAMYACRLAGMSSPAVGSRFDRDHSTVLHNWSRVGESARLKAIAERVAVQCGWVRETEIEAVAS